MQEITAQIYSLEENCALLKDFTTKKLVLYSVLFNSSGGYFDYFEVYLYFG
jgi:hypothetical protein